MEGMEKRSTSDILSTTMTEVGNKIPKLREVDFMVNITISNTKGRLISGDDYDVIEG